MKRDVLASLFDWLLCSTMSVCLTVVVLAGFVVDPMLQFNLPLMAGLCLLLQAVLFAGVLMRARAGVRIASYLIVCVIVIGIGLQTSTVGVMEDAEGNNFIFAVVLIVVVSAVFGLTRRRLGFAFLWTAGVFAVGYVQFVYKSGLVGYSLGFAALVVVQFVYRSYRLRLEMSPVPRRADLAMDGTVLGLGAVVTLVCLVGACLVFTFVIAPFEPGHLTVKLFVLDEALEEVKVNHPVRIEKVEDEDLLTEEITDESIAGNKSCPVDASSMTSSRSSAYMENAINYSGSQDAYSLDADDESDQQLVTYEMPSWWWLIVVAAVALLVVLAVIGRLLLRAVHRHLLRRLAPRDQVGAVYTEMVDKLHRVGVDKPSSAAPCEFARDAAARMTAFSVPFSRSNWTKVTDAYDAVHYGGADPTQTQLAECWAFYDGFAGNAKRSVGSVRYALRYFWVIG